MLRPPRPAAQVAPVAWQSSPRVTGPRLSKNLGSGLFNGRALGRASARRRRRGARLGVEVLAVEGQRLDTGVEAGESLGRKVHRRVGEEHAGLFGVEQYGATVRL